MKFHRMYESNGTFGNYFGVQEQKLTLRILIFDIPTVPPIQILTEKGETLSVFEQISF
jgi:hypothetical protein